LARSSTVDDTAGGRTARTAPLRRDVDTAVWRVGAVIGVGPVANPATDGTAERRETRKASVSTALACDGMNRMKKAGHPGDPAGQRQTVELGDAAAHAERGRLAETEVPERGAAVTHHAAGQVAAEVVAGLDRPQGVGRHRGAGPRVVDASGVTSGPDARGDSEVRCREQPSVVVGRQLLETG
jgi:hypothetical protein